MVATGTVMRDEHEAERGCTGRVGEHGETMVCPLTEEDLERYRSHGYVVLPGCLSRQDAAVLRQECERLLRDENLVHEDNLRTRFRALTDGRTGLNRIDPVADVSPLLAKLRGDSPITALARAVLGDEPLPYKDKVIVKPPGMTGYRLHQDYVYWRPPIPACDMTSIYLALDNVDETTGALELYSSMHHELLTPAGTIADPEAGQFESCEHRYLAAAPGDVVIFHPLAPHASADNLSDKTRLGVYFSYSAARHGSLYAHHYSAHRRYLHASLSRADRKRSFYR